MSGCNWNPAAALGCLRCCETDDVDEERPLIQQCDQPQVVVMQPPPQVTQVAVRVPVSPSRRGQHDVPPPFAHVERVSHSNSQDLGVNAPIVVLANCGQLTFLAQTDQPGTQAQITWQRTALDGNGATAMGNGAQATWSPIAAGGFRVTARIGMSAMHVHVVVVGVTVTAHAVQRYNGQHVGILYNPLDGRRPWVSSKLFDPQAEETIALSATLRISAGGDPALDGFLARVHAGFANNLLSTTLTANYQGGSRVRERVLVEAVQRPRGGLFPEEVLAGNAVWGNADLTTPILDRGGTRGNDQAAGGGTLFLAWNAEADTGHAPAHTREVHVTNKDKPVASFRLYCPVSAEPLQTLTGRMQFRAWLVAYSTDCDYTYVALGHVDWTCTYDIAVQVPWPEHRDPIPFITSRRVAQFAQSANLGNTGVQAAAQLTLIAGGQEASAAGCEVRPPAYKDAVYDSR